MRKKKKKRNGKWVGRQLSEFVPVGGCGSRREQNGEQNYLTNKHLKEKKRKFDYLFNPHNRKIRIKGNISKGRKETI